MSSLDLDTSLGPQRTVALSGGEIDYRERGEGRPLVFVHGFGVNAALWRKVVPDLAGDWRCISPTLPLGGHRRPLRGDADLTPAGLARLIAELLRELELDDAVVVGNDTGGALAQILVTSDPERVGALVLTPCDAFDKFFPWQFKALQLSAYLPGSTWLSGKALRAAALRRSPLGFGLLTKHGIEDDVTLHYVEPLIRDPAARRDAAKVLRGVRRRYTEEAARRLPQFERPALLAWAAEDTVFPLEYGERLAELLPDARIEVIEDSRTFVSEDQPQRLAAAIRGFLAV